MQKVKVLQSSYKEMPGSSYDKAVYVRDFCGGTITKMSAIALFASPIIAYLTLGAANTLLTTTITTWLANQSDTNLADMVSKMESVQALLDQQGTYVEGVANTNPPNLEAVVNIILSSGFKNGKLGKTAKPAPDQAIVKIKYLGPGSFNLKIGNKVDATTKIFIVAQLGVDIKIENGKLKISIPAQTIPITQEKLIPIPSPNPAASTQYQINTPALESFVVATTENNVDFSGMPSGMDAQMAIVTKNKAGYSPMSAITPFKIP